jgi:hypothetical protein
MTYAEIKTEIAAIKEEVKHPENLSRAQKDYLINRLVELTVELGNIALEKMKRGDKV